jgi:tRNA(Arg) A34 adenosine deaminase TadA
MAVNESAINDATAFLVHEKTIYYTDVPVDASISQPWTPLTALIEGIWNANPEFANKVLRNHLYSFYPRTPLCDGMIKVAAKRARIMTELESYEFTEKLSDQSWVKVAPSFASQVSEPHADIGRTVSEEEAIALAKRLALKSEQKDARFESDRAVGGVLLSDQNEVLSVGWNTNASQRIHHCEVNLIRNYLKRTGKKIPANSTLIITLKPCGMCAAQLFTFCDDLSSLKVIYLEDDPGPAAANSVLMKGSDLWVKAGKPVVQINELHFKS